MRTEDWPIRMQQAIDQHQDTPFSWGISDCGILFADVVEAMTGFDPLYDIRGHYGSARSALRALRHVGYKSVFDLLDDRFEAVPVVQLGRGDLVFPERTDALSSPAIVTGEFAISKNESGFVQVSRSFFQKGYRVS